METIVWEIELTDGRTFRVFCADNTQKGNVIATYSKIKNICKEIRVITTGVHTAKEWDKIVKNL